LAHRQVTRLDDLLIVLEGSRSELPSNRAGGLSDPANRHGGIGEATVAKAPTMAPPSVHVD
jgi:hypothetical protein